MNAPSTSRHLRSGGFPVRTFQQPSSRLENVQPTWPCFDTPLSGPHKSFLPSSSPQNTLPIVSPPAPPTAVTSRPRDVVASFPGSQPWPAAMTTAQTAASEATNVSWSWSSSCVTHTPPVPEHSLMRRRYREKKPLLFRMDEQTTRKTDVRLVF